MGFSFRMMRCVALAIPVFYVGVAEAGTNPFDEVCAVIAQSMGDSTTKCSKKGRPLLSYNYSFGSNSKDARLTLDGIIEKLGEPASVRGTNWVWRLDNPDKGAQQKKTVTIVFTYDAQGESKIMMDRVRPGAVKAAGKKRKKPKSTRNVKTKKNRAPESLTTINDDAF